MAAKKVTLAMLKSVAEDFNSFMFEEGKGIDLKLKQPDLQKEIVESAGELADDDTITAETAETLALLNITHEAQVAEAEEEEQEEQEVTKTDTDEEEIDDEPEAGDNPADEEEELEDEVEPEDPKVVKALLADVKKAKDVEAVKAIAKARGIRIPPPFLKDLSKLKTYVTGKLDGSAPAAPKADKKKKEDSGPKIVPTIQFAICENENITAEEVAALLTKKGIAFSPSTISTTMGGTKRTIAYLKELGRLK